MAFIFCLLAASAAVVADVLSLNAVGVLKVSVAANQPRLCAVQLVPSQASGDCYTIGQVLGTNSIPAQTEIKLFQADTEAYVTEQFNAGVWQPGTNVVCRGQGFWITAPTSHTFVMVGCVPDTTTAPTSTVALTKGLQLVSYPYPVANQTSDGLWSNAAPGDIMVKVGGQDPADTNIAAASWYDSGLGWRPTNDLQITEACWYRSYTNRTWVTVKPYTYP